MIKPTKPERKKIYKVEKEFHTGLTIADIIDDFKNDGFEPKDLIIDNIFDDDWGRLVYIRAERPVTEEDYQKQLLKYEEDLKAYNAWEELHSEKILRQRELDLTKYKEELKNLDNIKNDLLKTIKLTEKEIEKRKR